VTKVFAGLMSRWTMPFECAASSASNLNAQIEYRLDLQRLTSYPMPERLPLQQFHSDEGSPVGLVNFVDGADVRMGRSRSGLGFPLEAAESLRIVREFVGKEL
jgi:hypothetical protein